MSATEMQEDALEDESDVFADEMADDFGDEWEDEGESESYDAAPKKRSSLPFFLLILLILGGGGAFAWFNLMGAGKAPVSAPAPAQKAPAAASTAAADSSVDVDGLPMPSPIRQEAEMKPGEMDMKTADDHAAPPRQQEEKTAMESAPLTPLPELSFDDETEGDDMMEEMGTFETPSAPPSDMHAAQNPPMRMKGSMESAISAEEFAALSERIEALQNEVSALKAERQTETPKVVSGPTNNADIKKLQSALKQLEEKVDSLAMERSAESVEPRKKMSSPTPPPTRMVTPKPLAKPSASTMEEKGVEWVLKAAQPGQAWVSRDGEMRAVSIGERLPGIGLVSSISMVDGRWVVQGSDGAIRQ